MSRTTQKPGNMAAVVGLVASLLALPAFVFSWDIAAWVLALGGLFVSIAGVKRAGRTAGALVPAIIGIVIASFVLMVLAAMLVLFLTRPLRY